MGKSLHDLEVKTLHKRTPLFLSVAGISFSPFSFLAQRPSVSSASSATGLFERSSLSILNLLNLKKRC
ncbi:hypothetical protein L1987_48819 [Smallanthus sonchifolius]|uniref:Uncharacterized protein n=1 Tax=Smallanthus sonchifolius TaxID=185202 RepID=A0ACB9FTX3_9ASTR|nr:hypothetical protein L1987_48819 [Smallanthus sonchifolius]